MQKIDGIFLLDKPKHFSSNQALQKIKRLFNAKKAGHTGSLDPLATGMLPICFGEATKFSQYLLESDKSYQVQAILGEKTNTGDAEGDVIGQKPINHLTLSDIIAATKKLIGSIQQIPPMYSALKHKGQPLYKLARMGLEVERPPRTIQIYDFTVEQFSENQLSLTVHCSKGTYIRTLVEDLAESLGTFAYVSELRRLFVHPFQNSRMFSLEDLEKIMAENALPTYLLPIESSVQTLPSVELSTSGEFYLRMGNTVNLSQTVADGVVRMYANQKFLGIGDVLDGRVSPRRLVSV